MWIATNVVKMMKQETDTPSTKTFISSLSNTVTADQQLLPQLFQSMHKMNENINNI